MNRRSRSGGWDLGALSKSQKGVGIFGLIQEEEGEEEEENEEEEEEEEEGGSLLPLE